MNPQLERQLKLLNDQLKTYTIVDKNTVKWITAHFLTGGLATIALALTPGDKLKGLFGLPDLALRLAEIIVDKDEDNWQALVKAHKHAVSCMRLGGIIITLSTLLLDKSTDEDKIDDKYIQAARLIKDNKQIVDKRLKQMSEHQTGVDLLGSSVRTSLAQSTEAALNFARQQEGKEDFEFTMPGSSSNEEGDSSEEDSASTSPAPQKNTLRNTISRRLSRTSGSKNKNKKT